MANSEQKYCISTLNMIILIGIILSIFGIAATVIDIAYYVHFARYRIPISLGPDLFFYIAVVMYFSAGIQSCCLLCIDTSQNVEKLINTYDFFTLFSIICAFVDGIMKYSLNIFVSLMFFAYSILGALSMFVTWTAEQEIKKEKQAILDQFNVEQPRAVECNPVEQPMLNVGELPKFSMDLQVVKVEDENLKPKN